MKLKVTAKIGVELYFTQFVLFIFLFDRYQYGLKKGLLERARMQIKKHSKSVQSSISTVIPLDELPKPKDSLLSLPKPIEDNHIWESRNLYVCFIHLSVLV